MLLLLYLIKIIIFDSISSTHIRNLFKKRDFEKVIQFTSKDTFNILNNYFKKFEEV